MDYFFHFHNDAFLSDKFYTLRKSNLLFFFMACFILCVLCLCSSLPLLSHTNTPIDGLLNVKKVFFFIQVFNSPVFDFVFGVMLGTN